MVWSCRSIQAPSAITIPAFLTGLGRTRALISRVNGYVEELKPLLDAFGNEPRLTLILFTLDETAYSRELAPLRGTIRPCDLVLPGGSMTVLGDAPLPRTDD